MKNRILLAIAMLLVCALEAYAPVHAQSPCPLPVPPFSCAESSNAANATTYADGTPCPSTTPQCGGTAAYAFGSGAPQGWTPTPASTATTQSSQQVAARLHVCALQQEQNSLETTISAASGQDPTVYCNSAAGSSDPNCQTLIQLSKSIAQMCTNIGVLSRGHAILSPVNQGTATMTSGDTATVLSQTQSQISSLNNGFAAIESQDKDTAAQVPPACIIGTSTAACDPQLVTIYNEIQSCQARLSCLQSNFVSCTAPGGGALPQAFVAPPPGTSGFTTINLNMLNTELPCP